MESVCRGCNQQSTSLASIFDPYTLDLFQKCTALNICNDDGLPANICKSCHDICEQWFQFKQMCYQNDELFRQNLFLCTQQRLASNNISDENIKIELKQELNPTDRSGLSSNDGDNDDAHDYDNYRDDNNDYEDTTKPITIKQNDNIQKEKKSTTKKGNKAKNTNKMKKPKKEKTVKILQCDICSKIFTNRTNFIKHLKRHGEKQFICSYCGFRSHTNWCLNQHIRIHTGDKPYKCELCSSAFKRLNNLVVHRRKHTQEKPYKCDICSKTYFTNQQLKFHNLATHSAEQQPFACDFCNCKYKCEAILKRHKKNVHGFIYK